MPKLIQPLSALKVQKAKPGEKDQYLFDGGGLYLHIPAARYDAEGRQLPGPKIWRMKYQFERKPCKLTIGVWPAVSLEDARELRKEVRAKLAQNINPQVEKRRNVATRDAEAEDQGNTIEMVALQWYDMARAEWTEGHARTVLSRIKRDILPVLGDRRISAVTTRDVLDALQVVEDRQAFETAHRIRTIIGQIFTWAIIRRMPGVTTNPAAGLSKAMRRPMKRNMAAILDPSELGRLMRDIEVYAGSYVVKCALRLSPMLFVRPGELRAARWEDVDLDAATWSIPMEAMKGRAIEKGNRRGQVHVVPLASQAVGILRELKMFTGHLPLVFPGRSDTRCISGNTVNVALRTMGWDGETVCAHGFRATARTMLHETLGFSPDAIEAQLGHRVLDRLGSAYNRAQHLDERRRMMQAWADYLAQIRGLVT